MNKPSTKEEAESYILGRIAGLNSARLLIWGIGYDNDDTANMLKKHIMEEIYSLKEVLEIKYIGDSWFESAHKLLEQLKEIENES